MLRDSFLAKADLTQFRKYRNLCSRQVKHIGVEDLLFFRIRNEIQLVKTRRVRTLEFLPFAKDYASEIQLSKYYWPRVLYDKYSSVKSLELENESRSAINTMFLEEELLHLM